MDDLPKYDPELDEVHFELCRGPRAYKIICPGGFLPRLVCAVRRNNHDQGWILHELRAYIDEVCRGDFERFEQENRDVASYLRIWIFRFTKAGGIGSIGLCQDGAPFIQANSGIELHGSGIPSFDWTDAEVLNWNGFCCKVRVAGELQDYFPVSDIGLWKEEFVFILKSLGRIASSGSEAARRAPQLRGLLRDPHGRVYGRLQQFIHGPKLHQIDVDRVPRPTRERWATQIFETVRSLHDVDVLWGGYRRSLLEITIDANDDAHIADIAHGVWVLNEDEEGFGLNACTTKEEDLMALEMLGQFLGVRERFLRKTPGPRSIAPAPRSKIMSLPAEIRILIYDKFVHLEHGVAWVIDRFFMLRPAGPRVRPDDGSVVFQLFPWSNPPLLSVSQIMRSEAMHYFASSNVFHVECSWLNGFIHRLLPHTASLRRMVLMLEVSKSEVLIATQLHGLDMLLGRCRSLTSFELVLSCQQEQVWNESSWWERDPLLLKLRELRGLHSLSVKHLGNNFAIPICYEVEKWLWHAMSQRG